MAVRMDCCRGCGKSFKIVERKHGNYCVVCDKEYHRRWAAKYRKEYDKRRANELGSEDRLQVAAFRSFFKCKVASGMSKIEAFMEAREWTSDEVFEKMKASKKELIARWVNGDFEKQTEQPGHDMRYWRMHRREVKIRKVML